jgi:hypothetical protein
VCACLGELRSGRSEHGPQCTRDLRRGCWD